MNTKIVALFVATLLLFAIWVANTKVNALVEKKEMQTQIDSLNDVVFQQTIDIGRYDYAIDQLDTSCKAQIDSILNHAE